MVCGSIGWAHAPLRIVSFVGFHKTCAKLHENFTSYFTEMMKFLSHKVVWNMRGERKGRTLHGFRGFHTRKQGIAQPRDKLARGLPKSRFLCCVNGGDGLVSVTPCEVTAQ